MAIPYRKAWSYLENMEKKLGFALVERHKGGARGGRTTLTTEARSLLARFDELKNGVQAFVDGRFDEVFGDKTGGRQ
jgi:molybdate transport system regulatory protein